MALVGVTLGSSAWAVARLRQAAGRRRAADRGIARAAALVVASTIIGAMY